MGSNGATPAAPANNTKENGSAFYQSATHAHNHSPDRPFEELSIDPALVSKSPTTQLQQHVPTPVVSHKPAAVSHRSSETELDPIYPVKRRAEPKYPLTMAALCKIGGEDSPQSVKQQSASTSVFPPDEAASEEISYIYTTEYARGIDRFLETTWYTSQSIPHLLSSRPAVEKFREVLDIFATTRSDNYDTMRMLPAAESELVWAFMTLPRTIDKDVVENEPELLVVLNRLDIVENLVTGSPFDGIISVANAISNTAHISHPRRVKFWQCLGDFVKARPVVGASRPGTAQGDGGSKTNATNSIQPTRSRVESLNEMRSSLEQVEGRDCLYSMAIIHQHGPSFPDIMEFGPAAQSASPNPGTMVADKKKLIVAKRFLENSGSGHGTTQVVQRLCACSVRSWGFLVQPRRESS